MTHEEQRDLTNNRLPRYDSVLQEAEDQLAKRHGRRAAQEMIDDEERKESYVKR